MKTPEDIKKGLEYCSKVKGKCKDCPCYSDSECSIHLAADALAYIQQLESTQPKWISVEERLPENGQWVLTYCGGYANWFELNKWCGDSWLKIMPVTHWMPLPEPPKEDE